MSKVCKICTKDLDESNFQRLTRKDGRSWLSSYCKRCQNEKTKEYQFQTQYGIAYGDRDVMIASQDGKCMVCLNKFKNGKDSHVDHCHKTGKIRAILCAKCNPGLGYFDDDIEKLQRAIEYLKSHKEQE